MAKKLRKVNECLNCHHDVGQHNYCPNCGQINTTKDVPLKQFFKDFVDDVFTIDSKLIKSFKPLLLKPGFLTKEYIKGRRVSYILPLRLYFFVTIVFFSLVTVQGKIFVDETETQNLDLDDTEKYTRIFESHFKKYDDLDDFSSRLMSMEFARSFKIEKRDSAHQELLLSMKNMMKEDYTDSIYLHVIKNLVITFQKEKKKTNDLLFDELKQVYSDTSKARIFNKELNKTFRFKPVYYSAEWDAWDNFSKNMRTKYKINDSLSERIICETLIAYELRDRAKSKFTVFGGNKYEDFNIDTLNPSLIDQALIRFIKKAEIAGEKGESEFWKEMVDQIPTVMFIMLPIFAALFKLLYVRRKILYINHLIFSLHVHTIIFLYLLPSLFYTEWYTVLFTVLGSLIHVYLSMKSVYEQSHLKTIFKLLFALFLYFWALIFGFALLTILSVIAI